MTDRAEMYAHLQREAQVTTLREAVDWASVQAGIWRGRPVGDEPARTYMRRRYELLAEAGRRVLAMPPGQNAGSVPLIVKDGKSRVEPT